MYVCGWFEYVFKCKEGVSEGKRRLEGEYCIEGDIMRGEDGNKLVIYLFEIGGKDKNGFRYR